MQTDEESNVEESQYLQWSIIIESEHAPFGADVFRINNRCPFYPQARKYIDMVLKDVVIIALEKFNLRTQNKLNGAIKATHEYLAANDRFPRVKSAEIEGHDLGFQVIVRLGTTYRVDYFWSEFSEHVEELMQKYSRVGKDEISAFLTHYIETNK